MPANQVFGRQGRLPLQAKVFQDSFRVPLLVCTAVPLRKTMLYKPAVAPKKSFLPNVCHMKATKPLRMAVIAFSPSNAPRASRVSLLTLL